MTASPLVPFRDVCALLNMHPNTGYVNLAAKRFPIDVHAVGRRLFCRQVDIDRFLYYIESDGAPPADDGRQTCPYCRRRFFKLAPHTRAKHPELVGRDGA